VAPPRRVRQALSLTLLELESVMMTMGEMPMPGGWSMSMMWMRMPGQSWPGAALAFLGMWGVMMAAMMLPVLIPMLWHYRASLAATPGSRRRGLLLATATAAYFSVWTLAGLVVFVLGAEAASIAMAQPALARAAPAFAGLVVLAAGALQFTTWKARRLACCRETPMCGPRSRNSTTILSAWRFGLRIGVQCVYCCAGLTAILLVIGVMDLRAMAVVTAAICLERFVPAGERMAQAIGIVAVAAGLFMTLGIIPAAILL